MLEDRRIQVFVLASLCVLYTAVRLWGLTDSCLWFDELFSVHAAEHAWNSLPWFVALDLIHPPLFYILLKLWIAIGGESLLWLRLFPVLFSVIALIPFLLLCRELRFPTWTTAFALFLFAVSGSMIRSAQFVRMYSLLICISLFSIWLFARYFNRGVGLVLLALVNIILVYTHYYGWLVLAAQVIVVLIFQRVNWRRMMLMVGVVIASFIPWLVTVFQAARSGSDIVQNIAWQAKPGIRELFAFMIDLVEPFYYQASNVDAASVYPVSIPLIVVIAMTIPLYVIEWRQEERKLSVQLLVIFFAVPFSISFVASWILPYSVWGTRHLIMIFPVAMILIANAVQGFPVRAVRYAVVSLIIGLSAIGLVAEARRETPEYPWCEWEKVADEIRKSELNGEQPEKILTFENLVAYHMWFALRDTDRFRVGVVKGVDVLTDDETYFLPRGFDKVYRQSIDDIEEETLWLAFRTPRPTDYPKLIGAFEQRGYKVCYPYVKGFGPTTVFWVQMSRGTCG